MHEIDQARLTGLRCLFCPTSRSSSSAGIPEIHVGEYRKFVLCKKQHIKEMDWAVFEEIIEQELQPMRDHGDTPLSKYLNGSGETTPAPPSSFQPCKGFAVAPKPSTGPPVLCGVAAAPYLWYFIIMGKW